jgi:hypothetical protein
VLADLIWLMFVYRGSIVCTFRLGCNSWVGLREPCLCERVKIRIRG